ncbi:unnamed protein product, partial [Meganyctiphanes norvegica]
RRNSAVRRTFSTFKRSPDFKRRELKNSDDTHANLIGDQNTVDTNSNVKVRPGHRLNRSQSVKPQGRRENNFDYRRRTISASFDSDNGWISHCNDNKNHEDILTAYTMVNKSHETEYNIDNSPENSCHVFKKPIAPPIKLNKYNFRKKRPTQLDLPQSIFYTHTANNCNSESLELQNMGSNPTQLLNMASRNLRRCVSEEPEAGLGNPMSSVPRRKNTRHNAAVPQNYRYSADVAQKFYNELQTVSKYLFNDK